MKASRLILPFASLCVALSAPALAAAAPAVAGSPAPSDMVAGAAHQPAFLGVYAEAVPAGVAATLPEGAAAGVIVMGVAPHSPAAHAGIAPNDIILRVGDTPVGTREALLAAVRKCQAGQAVEITFLHKGKRTTAKVTLGAYPGAATPAAPEKAGQQAQAEKPAKPERPAPGQPPAAPGFLGVGVEPLPADLAAHFGFEPGQGVWIRELAPNGPAAEAGIQVHDIILKAADQPVGSHDQLARTIAGRHAGERVVIEGIRQGKRMVIKTTLGQREGPPPPARPRAGADAEDAIAKRREAMTRQQEAMRQAAEERAREMERIRKATEERVREMQKKEREARETMQRERRGGQPPAAGKGERERRQARAADAATPPAVDEELRRQIKALGEQIERLGRQVEKLEQERDTRR